MPSSTDCSPISCRSLPFPCLTGGRGFGADEFVDGGVTLQRVESRQLIAGGGSAGEEFGASGGFGAEVEGW